MDRYIPLPILETITEKFSDSFKVGSGGYGDVYKADYKGDAIAVKLLHATKGIDDQQFMDELNNHLKLLEHPNIVRLVGYCNEVHKKYYEQKGSDGPVFGNHIYKILCFEYMEGGSLDKRLSEESLGNDWCTHYEIIKGICNGLYYLHQKSILHLDLKPANILLDKYMTPKIADFGLSRIFTGSRSHVTVETVAGTTKYMPPELRQGCEMSQKTDIFSLGVTIIDVVAGPQGYNNFGGSGDSEFINEVSELWRKRNMAANLCQVGTCIKIAIQCVHSQRNKRPTIVDILRTLNIEEETEVAGSPDRISQTQGTKRRAKWHPKTDVLKSTAISTAPSDLRPPLLVVEQEGSNLSQQMNKIPLITSTTRQAEAAPKDIDSISYKDVRGQCTQQIECLSLRAIPSISRNQGTKMSNRAVDLATGAMGSLLHKLGDLLKEEYNLDISVKTDIESFSVELMEMQLALLKVSEVQRDNLDDLVKRWANKVREMSYDIEDVVDGFLVHNEHASNTGFFMGLMQKMFNLFKWGKTHDPIGNAIKDIKNQVQVVVDWRKRCKVDEVVANVAAAITIDPRISAIYKDQKELVGIKEPRQELIKWLSDEDGDGHMSKQQLKIVSIVGFGGLGKTTLAKAVYDKLQSQFHPRAFVPVGRNSDARIVFREILHDLGYGCNAANLNERQLIDEIRGLLENKRYFIVIDDIWDSSMWDVIRCALTKNNCGSCVVTTTRIHSVADDCCKHSTGYVYKMKPLNDQNSRKLFVRRIFGSQEACPNVPAEISTDILKKCGGLPLAIISIASLLAHNPRSRWDSVRNSLVSVFDGNHDDLKDMEQILDLSYRHLPHHLKTCLLDIGKYREDHEIEKDNLLRQWTAQGFVSTTRVRDAEDVAEDYFYALINMSMIQPGTIDYNDEVLSCRVHDIMLDLIRSKAAEENFSLVIDGPEVVTGEHKRVRRVSIQYNGEEGGGILAATKGSLSHVRSVLLFRGSFLPSFLVLKYVRVLHLEDERCHRLDLTGIRGLFLLRYLKIYCSTDLTLPSHIGELRQLETIEVEGLDKPTILPSDIVSLPRLWHLSYLDGMVLPDGIGRLKSLRTLRGVALLESSVDNIKGLGELTNLRELEMFSGFWIYNEADKMEWKMRIDALGSSIGRLSGSLKSLTIGERCLIVMPVHGWSSTLTPPHRLCKLDLSSCNFQRVPQWIAQLHDLYSLVLWVREVADGLRVVARLPSLAYFELHIRLSSKMEEKAIISGGEFRALKHLNLACPHLSLAFEAGAMPRLEKLHICFRYFMCAELLPVGVEHLPAGTLREICLAVAEDDKDILASQFKQHKAAVGPLLKRAFEPHHPAADITIDFHSERYL